MAYPVEHGPGATIIPDERTQRELREQLTQAEEADVDDWSERVLPSLGWAIVLAASVVILVFLLGLSLGNEGGCRESLASEFEPCEVGATVTFDSHVGANVCRCSP
jgi:hypothetical protein